MSKKRKLFLLIMRYEGFLSVLQRRSKYFFMFREIKNQYNNDSFNKMDIK